MNSLDFMRELKRKHGIDSDYAVSKLLGLDASRISGYRHGRREFDDATCVRVAGLLEIAPGLVLAEIHAERAKNDSAKHAWQEIAEYFQKHGMAGALVGASIIGLLTASGQNFESIQALTLPFFALHNIHYTHMFIITVLLLPVLDLVIKSPITSNWRGSSAISVRRVTPASVRARYVLASAATRMSTP